MTGSEPLPFAFGVSEFTTLPWPFEQDIERYAALGVEAIEVCEQKLDEQRFAEQMAMPAATGLAIASVQPQVRTFFSSRMVPEPRGLEARVARLRRSIERLAPFAPGAAFVVNTGAMPSGDMTEAIRIVADHLAELGRLAADHGIRIALEPLNPTAMNVESTIWTVAQAVEISDRADQPQVGLCLDLWNVWQEAAIEQQIVRAGERIILLQVADWRTPRSLADRVAPGDGAIPLGRLLRAVHASGYAGACLVEIFSQDVPDSLWDGDLTALIRRARSGLEAAWTTSRADSA